VTIPWIVGLATAGLIANRARIARETDAEYSARYEFGADGVALGAESFTLSGTNGIGVLLLHGSGDSPQSFRELARRLADEGYTVHAPLLPGHGRSPRAFAQTTSAEYYDSAESALTLLQSQSRGAAIVGLSMGGAIAARLAREHADVSALVLLAPYLVPPSTIRLAARFRWLWGAVTPYLGGRGESSVHDSAASLESRAYGTFSPGAVQALVETADAGHAALPFITQPTLVINSRQDNRIPADCALKALASFRRPVESHWVSGCGHVITVDYCKDQVATLVVQFLRRHAS